MGIDHVSWKIRKITKNMTLAFHASRKIKENVLENHGSRRPPRRLWKSQFTREKNSHFTFHGNLKGRITGHENTLYHPQLPCLGKKEKPLELGNGVSKI